MRREANLNFFGAFKALTLYISGHIYGMGISMGKSVIEERGRVLIPKDIREELKLKPGQHVIVEKGKNCITIRPATDPKQFSSELRGCIKKSKINPRDIKNIWRV